MISEELTIERDDLDRHAYIVGQTRTGKTNFIKSLALQDINAGLGVVFIDPHGDAAEDLIGCIPEHRLGDVLYFDPTSSACPIFNFFSLPYPPDKLTEDFVSLIKLFADNSWGPRMEHLLRWSVTTLLHSNVTRCLYDLKRLLTEPDARAEILDTVPYDTILSFWETEFPSMNKQGAADPILNKLSAFLVPTSPLFRLFSTPRNDFNMSRILDGKILIVNLSKGRLGDTPSYIIGGLISTGVLQAALARADLPEHKRRMARFYCDEFHSYCSLSFETILSEAGKYSLSLVMAHQFLSQLPSSRMLRGIFGNANVIISFRVSYDDALYISREMRGEVEQCRERGTPEAMTPDDFRYAARRHLKKWKKHFSSNGSQALLDGDNDAWQQNRAMQKEIARACRVLNDPYTTSEALAEITKHPFGASTNLQERGRLFSDWAFEAISYPTAEDLVDLERFHAFARIGRASNVHFFSTVPAPPPNPAITRHILETMQQRVTAAEQKAARQQSPARRIPRRADPDSPYYENRPQLPLQGRMPGMQSNTCRKKKTAA